jgi:hypothetical protein
MLNLAAQSGADPGGALLMMASIALLGIGVLLATTAGSDAYFRYRMRGLEEGHQYSSSVPHRTGSSASQGCSSPSPDAPESPSASSSSYAT